MPHPDICIAGAGIIGLSLALELERRGASVTVLERDTALAHASTAAAGMLAVQDPENPTQLQPLSTLSVSLYPDFLARIEALSELLVPFQTARTFQSHPSYEAADAVDVPGFTPGTHCFRIIHEHSVDPRQLAAALLAAVRKTNIRLIEYTQLRSASETARGLHLETSNGTLDTGQLVHASGAWSFAPVLPRKGQMLAVLLPSSLPLRDVLRTPDIYIVPRTQGPRAGHALIGATVEDVGYDTSTNLGDLTALRHSAAEFLPLLADETLCPTADQWAGLRPATHDMLPILGRALDSHRQYIATGHYRNGILLAPATAHVLAQLLDDEVPSVDLDAFSPARFLKDEKIAQQLRYSPSLS